MQSPTARFIHFPQSSDTIADANARPGAIVGVFRRFFNGHWQFLSAREMPALSIDIQLFSIERVDSSRP